MNRAELCQHRKILCVDERLLLDVLNCHRLHRLIALPEIEELPPDVEVIAVWPEPHRRALMVELVHPSFEPVLPGCPAPIIPGMFGMTNVWRLKHTGPYLEAYEQTQKATT